MAYISHGGPAVRRPWASPLLEETLAIQKAKLDPDHPDTLKAMNILAASFQDAGQPTAPCRSWSRRWMREVEARPRPPRHARQLGRPRSCHGLKGLADMATAGTNQARSFSSASAPGLDEAGFWPVTSLPSLTTKAFQFSTFS